ncbi:hypothetical protein AGMMS4956_00310 [Bacteroidia bacterium]|nr:hypothetical protein AGMMS4956_00310 [Bacteroidia bacterium]
MKKKIVFLSLLVSSFCVCVSAQEVTTETVAPQTESVAPQQADSWDAPAAPAAQEAVAPVVEQAAPVEEKKEPVAAKKELPKRKTAAERAEDARKRYENAAAEKARLDEIRTAAQIEEREARKVISGFQKEKHRLDQKAKKDLDANEKLGKSTDKEVAREARAAKKQIKDQYVSDVEDLKTRYREAKSQLDHAQKALAPPFDLNYQKAVDDMAASKKQLDESNKAFGATKVDKKSAADKNTERRYKPKKEED